MEAWVTAGIAASAAIFGTVVTLLAKRIDDRRLRKVDNLERDLKSADLFVTLMKMANGRAETIVLSEVADRIAQSPLFLSVLTQISSEDTDSQARLNLSEALRIVTNAAVVSGPVGEAAQLAAGQLAASLADRYPSLRPAALLGLTKVKTFLPDTDIQSWADKWNAPSPRWYKRLWRSE